MLRSVSLRKGTGLAQHGELIFLISNHPSFLDLYGFEAGPPANNRYFA